MSVRISSKRWSMRATKKQLLDELERLQRRIDEFERSADQHQRVNQAPRERAGQLSLIVDHLPALISYVDSDQRYCFVNSTYEKWFGHSQREVEGRHVKEVLGEPAYQAIKKYVTRALAGELVTYESAVPYKDGGERYIDATYVPDFTQDGKVRGFFVLVRDISEPKRAEEGLRRAYDELKFRVEERTVELRNANEALSESEEQVRLLLNSTAEAIYGIDLEGNCTFANPACAEMLGYDRDDDLLGKHIHELIHHTRPDGARYPAEESLIYQAFRRGEGTHVEDEVLWRRDGTSFAAEYWSYPVRRDDEVVGAVVTFLDITERRRSEQALRESEARYHAVVEDQTEMISRHTPEGIRTFVNEAYCRFHGKRRDQLLGRSAYGALAPEDLDRLKVLHASLNVGKPAGEFEVSFPGPNGETIWQLWTKRAIFDASGRVTEFQAVGRDITEHRRSEEATRELAAIVESTDDAVLLERPDGTIVHCNAAAERIYGYSREELIGKSATILGPPDRPDDLPNIIKAINCGEHIGNFEAVRRRKDGSLIEVSVSISPVKDENGNVTAIVAIVRDITELKETRNQLQQAQKMEAICQLIGGVAHDFNNLLAVIQGNAELLAEGAGTRDPMIQAIIRSSRRGGELTQRLLAFSLQQPLRPQSVNLAGLTTGMSALLERPLGETIEIATDQSSDLWPVMADPGQLENALLNLAINARDAMPEGGKLTVECMNASLDEVYVSQNPEALVGDYVVMAVSDTGVGMTDEVREHAFEPFFTTKEVGKGSGLGLSMVYGFAKQSGGHVTIDSESGRGTTMRLYLPRALHQVESEGETAFHEEPRGEGEVVLVIEDDTDVRAMTVAIVKGLGYRALEAAEAASARALLSEGGQVDLLLCDVVLPGGVTGPEFAEAAQGHDPDIKVVFMSGYAAEAAKSNSILGSGRVLLTKPFQRAELAKILRDVLDHKDTRPGHDDDLS